MKRDLVLRIAGAAKHHYDHGSRSGKRGRPPSHTTPKAGEAELKTAFNAEVVDGMKTTLKDPDTDYGYRKMTYALMVLG